MSDPKNSNVIQVNFAAKRKPKKCEQTPSFSTLMGDVMSTSGELDEWPEDLTPRERCDQLKKDLEFLRKMNDASLMNKY